MYFGVGEWFVVWLRAAWCGLGCGCGAMCSPWVGVGVVKSPMHGVFSSEIRSSVAGSGGESMHSCHCVGSGESRWCMAM